MLDNETKRRIDTCRDILVGKVPDPKSQVEQISIALIYKFMDDMDREAVEMGGKAGFFTGEYKKYAWSKIFDPRLGGFDMLALYSESITRMSQNPGIPQLFRDIFKNAYLPYRDPETLKLFLKSINEFTYDHSERLGDAFEYLLSVLGSQGDAGQFRTPRHIIDFMVEVVKPQKHETILDPACGTAGFLVSSYKHILRTNTKKVPGDLLKTDERKKLLTNFKGYDISPDMVRLSLVNLYLHGFVQPQVMEYDTLTSEDRWNEYADVILANPPFMSPKGGIKPHKRFSVQSNRSEVLFVDYIAEHLTPTGRAAVIVPEGIIFQSANAYKQLRKYLVDEGYIYAVVSLPAGVFNPYSAVKTSILLMDKTIAKKADSILFIKVDNDGFGLGAQRRAVDDSDLPGALDLINGYLEAVRSGKTFNSDKLDGNAILVAKEALTENGEYNLTGERHRVSEKRVNQKWPMLKIGEVCSVISGQSPESEFYNENAEGTPFYQGKTEFTDKFIGTPTKWTTQETKIAIENDILMSVRAPVGPVNIATQRICIGRGLAAIRASEKILMPYVFTLLKINEKNIKGNGGAVFDSINRNDIEAIQIPLPPLDIQREIVAEIEGYQKIIDGARQVVDNWKPQIDIDPDWPLVTIGDVSKVQGGFAFKSEDMTEENGVQIIKIGNVKDQRFSLETNPSFIKIDSYDNYPDYQIKLNDILISMTGTAGKRDYGNVCMVDVEGKYLLNQRVGRIIPNSHIISRFLYLILNQEKTKDNFYSNVTGGVRQGNISNKQIEAIHIPLPPLDVQQEIVNKIEAEREVVDGCNSLIKIYEDKIKQVIDKVWEE